MAPCVYVRALHPFTAGEPSDLSLSPGDVVRLTPQPAAGAGDAWLHGQNVLSLCSGYFPRSHVHLLDEAEVALLGQRGRTGGRARPPPIQADECRELNNDSGYVGSPLKGAFSRPIYTHLLQAVYVVTPAFCTHCGDYIWGTGPVGQRCAECGDCFHGPCARCSPLHPCQRANGEAASPRTFAEQVPIHKWTSSNVLEWMASINLINPVEIFKSMNIDGMELLNLDKEKLMTMGIKDPYIQSMLLLGVKRLQAGDGGAAGEPRPGAGGHSASDHQLRPASFSRLRSCQACGLPLLGTDHQGLTCIDCGLVVHRRCGAQPAGLPACDAGGAGRPPPSLFGAELSQLFQPGRQPGPPLLQLCLAQLERRCQQDVAINCYELYESTVSWDELQPLRDAVDLDLESVDLNRFELAHISSLVKKFLAHLPNPVIPIQAYDEMAALAEGHMDSAEGCAAAVEALVTQLQDHHQATLRLLMRHICRLCQLQQARGCRYPPTQLLKTLSFVLIRPPFEQITFWPERTALHTRLLELLVMNYDWGGQPYPECVSPPALPPRQPQPTPPAPPPQVPPRRAARDLELERAGWYWGSRSREEVSEKLNGQPDGTFLVRDSLTAAGEYTLSLRKGGNNRLIRIYCRNGKYGFSEPCNFDSVVQLIDHYRNESLRKHNVQLDVRLEVPLVESRQYDDKYSTADLLSRLRETQIKYEDKAVELESLDKHRCILADRITVQKKAKEAYEEVLRMLEEEKQLHINNRDKAQLHEHSQLLDNWRLLESRVNQVEQCQLQVEDEIRRQTSYFKTIENDQSMRHQEERRLLQQKRDLERELLRREVRRERLDRLLAGREDGPDRKPLAEQEEYWLLEGCDRLRAEALLLKKPDGTFLIRRRTDKPDVYVLSIVALGNVQHCCVDRSERGFGFSQPYAIYPTLRSLVDHYAENDLGEFNEKLPTRLLYPVLGSQPD
ncbi:phosphatidylinositol 3-kinase regulatory subunit alpha-like [Pollicipes pollicipes]|uniref:phosphatidylinositol 3-kinase regulatory subunit alpha-like n=1 Tax=Pollicipes pollicipes TaxID=41117 RepID=UPI00188525E7|nr:phosphatidylinositol 3-kinase regulatory subunit alpha-like [Pollicipes pollicipes]